ncbi:unnamed protein product [Adineta steineri]|uniref:Glycerophosphocholine phosphodiesterase GPCPD1 n=1 Tax=Adineta steineri TaxID=433720 RepID=A0A814X327_9BILA|nr:unnamed protein product [Adineta steineri]CAF3576117.1 unnamed protein product [Adineta steineri]
MIRRVIYDVEFRVLIKEKLNPCDSVLVTGSCEQLGEWLPNRCIPLNRTDKTDDGEIWSTNIKIYGPQKIFYRYLIAQIVRIDDDLNLIVKKWETFKKARLLSLNHITNEADDGPPSITDTTVDSEPPDDFPAIFGCYKGEDRTDIGWLTGQTEIQLRFHSNALQIWSSKLRNSKISLKVSPIDLNYQQENEEILSDQSSQVYTPTSKVFIQSAILRLSGCEANFQSDYGAIIEKDDYMVVKIQTFEPENVAYHIDFYLVDETTSLRKHIGFAYVLPIHSNLELADNKHINRIVPIIGLKHNPIGQIKIDVLLITPLESVQQKFLVTPSKYWRQGRRPVNVGHRGLGKTNTEHIPSKAHQTTPPNDSTKQRIGDSSTPPLPSTSRPVQTKFVSENTLASFKGAFQLGFDFVEFDVQLSKDKIPVVYHDFQVAITLKRKGQEAELFVIPVKDLTLPQLQCLKIYHASKEGEVRKGDEELDDDDQTNTNNNITPTMTTTTAPATPTTFTPMTNGENEQMITSHSGQQQDEKKFRSLFPTLQELFEKLDPHLGFNVEIKYAMEYKQGGSEQNHYFERNEYIDCILRCLITYAGKRVIVLSTFDPDCASMLRRKQTLFPVLFLTQGEKGDWPQFLDVRTWSINVGLCFIVTEHLSGLAAPVLDILSNKEFVKHVKENGKLLFIWGDEASDKEVSKSLLDLRVDGLIFDHVAELKEEHSTTENLFISEEREELEVINNFRQKQLELQHLQLLQELERLKTVRETSSLSRPHTTVSPTNQLSKASSIQGQDQSLIIDSNFKHLM